MGVELVAATDQYVEIGIFVMPHHLNLMGIVHGGVLSSLLDNAMGAIILIAAPKERTVTSNLNVNFLAPAQEGFLTATGEILHRSRRSITAQARVEDAARQLVCIATGTFRVLS